MSEENRRRWMSGYLEEEDYDAIMEIATEEGKHPAKIIEIAIQLLIEKYAETKSAPKTKIRALVLQNRSRQNQFAMLKQLAYTWNDTQDDDDYRILAEACDIAKVDIDVVIEAINDKAKITGVISTSATGLRAAEMWLEELLDDGKMYAVAEIKDMAEDRKFAWHTVTAAKRKRNIVSVKDGNAWYWLKGSDVDIPASASVDF